MTKDFHPGCSFDKGRHPRPRRGERLTLKLEEGTPNLIWEKYELENQTGQDFKDFEEETPNPSREKYENS